MERYFPFVWKGDSNAEFIGCSFPWPFLSCLLRAHPVFSIDTNLLIRFERWKRKHLSYWALMPHWCSHVIINHDNKDVTRLSWWRWVKFPGQIMLFFMKIIIQGTLPVFQKEATGGKGFLLLKVAFQIKFKQYRFSSKQGKMWCRCSRGHRGLYLNVTEEH